MCRMTNHFLLLSWSLCQLLLYIGFFVLIVEILSSPTQQTCV